MKLISMSCPSCGAALEVNADLKSGICNYCGRPFAIDPEVIHVQHDVSEDAGYKFEKGRIKAQEEAQARARRIAEAEAERKRLEEERQMRQAEEYRAQQKKAEKISRLIAMFGAFIAIMGFLMILLGLSSGERFNVVTLYGCGMLLIAIVCAVLNIYINKRNHIERRMSDPIVIIGIVVVAIIRIIVGP